MGIKKVVVAPESGFCYGVQRAMDMVERALRNGQKIALLGPIIHNPIVIKQLEMQGARIIEKVSEAKDEEIVFIRSHGVPPDIYEEIKKRNLRYIDATCPFVARAQRIVKEMSQKNFQVVIIGKKHHPEIIGLRGYAKDPVVITEPFEVDKLSLKNKIAVVVQTTFRKDVFEECLKKLMEKKFEEIHIFNTRCFTTDRRQEEVKKLSKYADMVIVIGGKMSSNTRRLYEIAKKYGKKAYHIEDVSDIKKDWFNGVEVVGICAGASTPFWLVEKVVKWIKRR